MITDNEAAWAPYEKANHLDVGPGPQPAPDVDEVVIKVAYAAINPTDHLMQVSPYFEYNYPYIFGVDVAGTVVQLGSGVTRFKIGQRVMGHCDGILTRKVNNSGFQRYSTCKEILVAEVPSEIPLMKAAVLPISIDTAATGLYKHLKLPLPSLNPKMTERVVLIWGGSSSVGSTAIQWVNSIVPLETRSVLTATTDEVNLCYRLAKSSGLIVATTAGQQNHEYVKALGADYVFDYKDPRVVDEIIQTLKAGTVVFDVIGFDDTQLQCAEIVSRLGGGMLPTSRWPVPTGFDNVTSVLVNSLDPGLVNPDLGSAIWGAYVSEALAAGVFRPAPEPEVLQGGLARVQEGIDLLASGVSAKKIVIEITAE